MRITVPVGTRPEIIKLAGVVGALRAAGHTVRCIATGQHDDPRMAGDIFDELGCAPDAVWSLEGDEGRRVATLLGDAFDEMATHAPDAVLVLGDTYTAPLLALAARRHGVGVVHLEAGLRSFNERSMEETNRRLMAALATLHLAPSELAASFLRAEGVAPDRIRVVGNPIVDAMVRSGVERVPVERRSGSLLTAHRATNVDDPARLREIVRLAASLGAEAGPVTFPLHPRTRSRLHRAGLLDRLASVPGVALCDPLGYGDMLARVAASRLVVTDSGGLQEEASYFGIPCVVLRSTTPRWELVQAGAAELAGMDADRALRAVRRLSAPAEQRRIDGLACPYGDGHTAARVVDALADPLVAGLIRPAEPALGAAPFVAWTVDEQLPAELAS